MKSRMLRSAPRVTPATGSGAGLGFCGGPGCQRDRITVDDENAGRGIRPKPVEQTVL
jgi:hypothetical protein